jgi:hypothetical protein
MPPVGGRSGRIFRVVFYLYAHVGCPRLTSHEPVCAVEAVNGSKPERIVLQRLPVSNRAAGLGIVL